MLDYPTKWRFGGFFYSLNGTTDWYRYTTNNWGKTWGRAVKVDDTRKALAGVFQPAIEVKPSRELLDSLLGSLPK